MSLINLVCILYEVKRDTDAKEINLNSGMSAVYAQKSRMFNNDSLGASMSGGSSYHGSEGKTAPRTRDASCLSFTSLYLSTEEAAQDIV